MSASSRRCVWSGTMLLNIIVWVQNNGNKLAPTVADSYRMSCPPQAAHCFLTRTPSEQLLYTQIQFILYDTSASLRPQRVLKRTTARPPCRALDEVLLSLRAAIDMNGDSYMKCRLLLHVGDSGRHWAIQLEHCAHCLPWVCVSVVTAAPCPPAAAAARQETPGPPSEPGDAQQQSSGAAFTQ